MKCGWCPPTVAVLLMVHWSTVIVQAGSIVCDDSDLCLSKRFLRFGRNMTPDPYYRLRRQSFRLNRSYQPYQDKRFLRFGRSQLGQLQGLDDVYNTDVVEPYSRKRRSLDTDSQLQITHNHVRRAADQSELEQPGNDDMSKMITKRAILGKRFMRFGRDFGQEDEKNNMEDSNNSQFSKRFMRFGKSLGPTKRFMRFGRNHGLDSTSDILVAPLPETSKRFLRFGKRKVIDTNFNNVDTILEEANNMNKLDNVLSLANRLKSEAGELGGGV